MWTRTTFLVSVALCACGAPEDVKSLSEDLIPQQFAQGHWQEALNTCALIRLGVPDNCDARYCELLARTMLFVDQFNDYLLPRFRTRSSGGLDDVVHLLAIDQQLAALSTAADAVTARGCSYDLPMLPLRIGEVQDPLLRGEVRGRHTPRGAYLLGAIANAFRYLIANLFAPQPVPPPPPGETTPGLPALLENLRRDLVAHDALLFSQRTNPTLAQGGWWDKDGNGIPSEGDELLIDIFEPGTEQRVFDFSDARFAVEPPPPRGALTTTAQLPPARCGYQRWHIDTLLSGPDIGTVDGMTFSPDGKQIALPLPVNGLSQIHLLSVDGKNKVCLTCTGATAGNDGVRWRPGAADRLLFVSNRDHPFAIGGSGGGAGQELYAMRSDGSGVTRLTRSPGYATNYHPNWSADGRRIVWGATDLRTWDVMIADFVEGAGGPQLGNVQRLARDTTWTETHGFSADGRAVIVTNTRAGMMSPDIYAIDLASGARTRLTDAPAWDEHAHLSPDGRELAWMSGAWRPASVLRLNDGTLSPLFDFFWIAPGVFFEFVSPPAGYATELSLMDADGKNLRRLTNDGLVVADNEWSPDSRQILFRQVEPKRGGKGKIRLLTFDDCGK